MNKLQGQLVDIQKEGDLSHVYIEVAGNILQAIVIDNPEEFAYVQAGSAIQLWFKETAVVLAKSIAAPISMENQLRCQITDIQESKMLTKVYLQHSAGPLVAIITTEAYQVMTLQLQEEVIALVKANEIMLA
ncbi:MAG: TOBE domain-containing protein [Saprospiraceae bacterium]